MNAKSWDCRHVVKYESQTCAVLTLRTIDDLDIDGAVSVVQAAVTWHSKAEYRMVSTGLNGIDAAGIKELR